MSQTQSYRLNEENDINNNNNVRNYNTVEEYEDDGYSCSKAWAGYKACIVAVAHVK